MVKQPDLGTSILILSSGLYVIFFAGLSWRLIVPVLLLGAVGVIVLVSFGSRICQPDVEWPLLREYQKHRVCTLLDPSTDPLGKGFHTIQGMIAVGSGELTGKGWGQGTQTGLSFLPEQHTDFIFSVWAEEQGFLACAVLLALYGFLMVSALSVAFSARDRFGAFVAVGVTAMIFWQVFENIGMVIGLLPVTGITLPLMSYGGSSMVSVMASLGLLVNIGMRRHMF